MRGYYLLTLILFCLVFVLDAQVTTSEISGKVMGDGELLIGATIKAIHEPSGSVYRTVANVGGRYNLQGMMRTGVYR